MKHFFISLLFTISCFSLSAQLLQNEVKYNDPKEPKSIGIVLYSNDVETVFNALRLAAYSQEWDNKVQVFLLGKGVELEKLIKENADINEQFQKLIELGGEVMGCQTCFKSRQQSNSKICKLGCIEDLYEKKKKNQIVLTF